MRVFVTGASGFIGSQVVRALLNRGHSAAILSKSGAAPARLMGDRGKVQVYPGSLGEPSAVRSLIGDFRPEACVHLAWIAEPGKYLDSMENLSCLSASGRLFDELIRGGCGRIIGAGTCAEYAPSDKPLREDSPAGPKTLYAASKSSCGLLGRQLADLAKVSFAWGRIFFPYGPDEDERRVIPAAIRALLKGVAFPATSGDQVRDYIHVEDVAGAFCIMAEKNADGVFNISSSRPTSVRQILEKVGRLAGREDLIQFGAKPLQSWEPPLLVGENLRLRELGWEPLIPLEQGLQQTVEWFKTREGQ